MTEKKFNVGKEIAKVLGKADDAGCTMDEVVQGLVENLIAVGVFYGARAGAFTLTDKAIGVFKDLKK